MLPELLLSRRQFLPVVILLCCLLLLPRSQRNRAFSSGRHPRTLVALNLIGPLRLVFRGSGRRKRMLDLFGIPRYSSLPRVEPSLPRCVVRKERAPAIRPSQRDSTALDTAVLSHLPRAQCYEFVRLFDLLFSYCQKFISARFVRATLQFFSLSLAFCALDLALDTFGETPGCCLVLRMVIAFLLLLEQGSTHCPFSHIRHFQNAFSPLLLFLTLAFADSFRSLLSAQRQSLTCAQFPMASCFSECNPPAC